jgi:hypothetical protein
MKDATTPRQFRLIINGSSWQTVEALSASAAAAKGEAMWKKENGGDLPHSVEARSE